MIKIFRHIRKSLIQENKMGKYFKYAIGEIILVVIGILIALQINNWSEAQKDKRQEQEYYCLLLEEFQQDKEQVLNLKILTNERIDGANKAIKEFQKTQPDLKILGKNWLIAIRLSTRTFQPNDATYLDIKSSGKLNIIRDKKVTKELNKYYNNVNGYTETILRNVDSDQRALDRIDNWFETGLYHGNLESFYRNDVFTEDIRNQLKADLPKQISKELRPQIYNALAISGIDNRRRLELLQLIENEIDHMQEFLQQKCKS